MEPAKARIRRGIVDRFRLGLALLLDAVGLLRAQASLWPLAVVPVGLALVCVGTSLGLFGSHVAEIHAAIAGWLPSLEASAWWSWLWVGPGRLLLWLVGWLGVVAVLALALVVALLLANLLAAPFLDRLSQRVEEIVLERPAAGAQDWPSMLRETMRSFLAELGRVAFLGSLFLVLTAAGFLLPGAHLITGPLLVVSTVLFLPLDYAGFALDRRGVSFARRRRWVTSDLPTMSGFGGLAFLVCLVPGLNLLMLPVLVTAGTLLVLRAGPDEDEGDAGAGSQGSAPDASRATAR